MRSYSEKIIEAEFYCGFCEATGKSGWNLHIISYDGPQCLARWGMPRHIVLTSTVSPTSRNESTILRMR